MTEEYKILEKIKNGDVLNDEQIQALADLKACVHNVYDDENAEYAPDVCYLYATLAERGYIEDDKDFIILLYSDVLANVLDEETAEYAYKEYPNAFAHVKDMLPKLRYDAIYTLYDFYSEDMHDDITAFACALAGANAHPQGLIGGFSLVDTILWIDRFRLLTGLCYMKGKGTETDLLRACSYFMSYHTDHLAQKWGCDELEEDTLSELFEKLKAESDAGKNYPGLHYYLGMMYREGIGTAFDFKKFIECNSKEGCSYDENPPSEIYNDGALDRYASLRINEDCNRRYYKNVKEYNAKDIRYNDIVRFGKYNHRDVLWYVIRVQKDRALLLSTDCIESSYIAGSKDSGENDCYDDSSIRYFTKGLLYRLIEVYQNDENFNYLKTLVPDDRGDYVFLLGMDETGLMFSLEESVKRKAGAAMQARVNGYGGMGVEVDEKTESAPWWTSTDGDQPGTLVYIDSDGEICEAPMYRQTIGIRPAIWLKLNK